MRSILSMLAAMAAVILLAGFACAIAGERAGWPFDLAAHFWPHLMGGAVISVPLAIAGMTGAGRATCLVLCFATFISGVHATSLPTPVAVPASAVAAERQLTVVAANVWGHRSNHAQLLDWILREDPDLVVLSEVGEAVAAGLAGLTTRLPYTRLRNMGDIAIASRWPWEEVVLPQRPGGQIAVARVATPSGPLLLIGTHPVLPATPDLAARRDRLIDFIATLARDSTIPVIVAGDFNATPWSRPMRGLAASGLRFGPGAWDPTWPTWLPRPFGVAIDHVLGGSGCRVVRRRHGGRIGSDHWPIAAELSCAIPAAGRG